MKTSRFTETQIEPHRENWRHFYLRGRSQNVNEAVFTGGERAGGSDGFRAYSRPRVEVVSDMFHSWKDWLHA